MNPKIKALVEDARKWREAGAINYERSNQLSVSIDAITDADLRALEQPQGAGDSFADMLKLPEGTWFTHSMADGPYLLDQHGVFCAERPSRITNAATIVCWLTSDAFAHGWSPVPAERDVVKEIARACNDELKKSMHTTTSQAIESVLRARIASGEITVKT